MLCGLRNCVDLFSVVTDRDQLRSRGSVIVPQIVMHHLEMPETFPGARVKSQEAIGGKVRAGSIGAVIVISRRPGGEVGDAPLLVNGDLAPRVGSARVFPRILRPGFETEFIGMRNGVESPDHSSADYIIGPDIPGRR